MLRTCVTCGLEKEYDASQKRNSKSSGFMGAKCWDCFLVTKRERAQQLVTDPDTGAVITAGALAYRKKVIDPETGEPIRASDLKNRKRKLSGYYDEYRQNRQSSGAQAAYLRDRFKSDALFKLRYSLSSLIRGSMKGKGFSKSSKTADLVGCSYEFLLAHLQASLPDWESHDVIHIDHILPCSCATDEVEMRALQHWSNLQWLPGAENLAKSDKKPIGWEDRLADLVHHTHG